MIPKGRTITSLRNRLYELPGVGLRLMFSYNAGISELDYGYYVDLLTDVRLALRFARTGTLDAPLGQYQYVEDFTELIQQINDEYDEKQKVVEVAFDTETVGLDPYASGVYPVCLQFSRQPGESHVRHFASKQHWQNWLVVYRWQLEWLLNSPKISLRGANLKFDMHWMWVHANKMTSTNFKFDTTLVGSLQDENRSNSLNVHAKIHTEMGGYDDAFNRSIDKSRMDLVPKHQMLPYAGGDTDACLRVSKAQKTALLADQRLAAFYVNILHPAARAFEMLEQGGICLDMAAYNELEADLNTKIVQLIASSKDVLGGRIVAKHADSSRVGGLNLSKESLIRDFMFSPMGLNLKPKMVTEKTKVASTSLDHIEMFKDVPEAAKFVEIFTEYTAASKTLSTYVMGFRKHIRSDGRFHPTYFLFAGNKDAGDGGTNTGRLSCLDPAFQTIPKHTVWAKAIRRCFVAPPGYQVVELDYSQGELRVVACIANEPSMIEAYRNSMDLHALSSGSVAGYSYAQMMELKQNNKTLFDEIRQLGKALNFGLIYGMGAVPGFQNYAALSYKVVLTAEECHAYRDGFFGKYPVLLEYHAAYKAYARRHGNVRSPLGRLRHLPLINSPRRDIAAKAERQAVNSPVQSTLHDMMLWAIALAHQAEYTNEAPFFGETHDASYMYAPEDRVVECANRQRQVMEELPFGKLGWNPQLRFPADAKIGPNMADLKELKVN